MSTIKANNVQLGQSGTATQNFTLTTGADGTMKLARGNQGATTQDVLTVDAAGKVAFPQGATSNAPAFNARKTASSVITSATITPIVFNDDATAPNCFDTASAYDSATGRFQPTVPGYYFFAAGMSISGSAVSSFTAISLRKNGAVLFTGTQTTTAGVLDYLVSGLVYLNGSTDYVDVVAFITGTTPTVFGDAGGATYFNGFLARAVP